MDLLQLFRCAVGRHRRDGNRVHMAEREDRSVCTGCGAAMVRRRGDWRIARAADDEAGEVSR